MSLSFKGWEKGTLGNVAGVFTSPEVGKNLQTARVNVSGNREKGGMKQRNKGPGRYLSDRIVGSPLTNLDDFNQSKGNPLNGTSTFFVVFKISHWFRETRRDLDTNDSESPF